MSLLAVLALGLVHLFAAHLPFVRQSPRTLWLSLAGGVPVAFVFLQILPALAHDEQVLAAALGSGAALLKNHVYLVALGGLIAFYGIEQAVRRSRRQPAQAGAPAGTTVGVFWLGIAAFAGVNAIIGYLLVQQERSMRSLLLFGVAMGLKFMVDDYGLHKAHEAAYDRVGRWVVTLALLAGWTIGVWTSVPPVALAVLRAFLAGGILLNVLKEELPAVHAQRFWAFALGATLYAVILLAA